jgi:hypothetical protein
MGEIWSCVQPRSKLDALLSDNEREQLIKIYESLTFDKSKPVKLTEFRTQLSNALDSLSKKRQLQANLWEDWVELDLHFRFTLMKQPEQTELFDKLSFLHLWKLYGSSKRQQTWPALCCSAQRTREELIDYDEQRWKLHKVARKLSESRGSDGDC